jgi:hypothetical protein
LLAAIAALALGAAPSHAQNFALEPAFGQATLNAGFAPDPHTVEIVAGGEIDAGAALGVDARGTACIGTIADAPDYRLQYTAGALPLTFSFVSDGDTTLVINAPDGAWYCDDDGGGFPNPMVEFATPMSGQYDIWVGVFGGGNPAGTLSISELGGPGAASFVSGLPPPGGAGPNFGLDPTFGEVALAAGFTPDPHSVPIIGGGEIDAFTALEVDALGNGCYGMIAEAPDYRLQYTAGGGFPLFISVLSDADTTLVINAPDGNWYCDDDGGGYPNPLIRFDNPASGQYDIWVGAIGGGNPETTLNISEVGGGAAVLPPAGGGPDFNLPPNFGGVTLAAGFAPDPHTVAIVAGGEIDAYNAIGTDVLGNSCLGTIAAAPDYRLQYTAASFALTIRATAVEDTTLVINAPDGNWYCNDDGAGFPNPEVVFSSPLSGQYDIWIGAYAGGGNPNATLTITDANK